MVGKMLLAVGCWLLAGPVIAQEWTFGEPEKLPAAINSDAEEGMPVLAPDGRTLYFTRMMSEDNVGGKYAGQDIWVSEFDGHGWTKADNEKLPFNNRKERNAVVGVSADGNTLYLLKARANKGLRGIYFSKRLADGWTEPELIPIEGLAPEGFIGLYVSPDFDVILISMEGADSRGEEDLYVSLKDGSGKWSKPKNLGTAINTSGFEISPFLTADKKRLFFSSNGHRGLGDADIFYSDRLYDSWETWSTPRNVGDVINSKGFDAFFAIQDTLVYFASNRNNAAGDLFQAVRSSAIGKTELEVKKIIAEARNLLGEISYQADTSDIYSEISFIRFEDRSFAIDGEAKKELDIIAELLSIRKSGQVKLVGNQDTDDLSRRRIQEIRNYLQKAGLPGLKIEEEIRESPDANWDIIELHY